jgi:predicted N-acetyltransferase YhbS
MTVTVRHLFDVPEQRLAVAELIHDEFWITVPGASAAAMAERLTRARGPEGLPLCLVALQGDEAIGTVNLVASDGDSHPEWAPWLAGMVVARGWRGQGVGSTLVLALLREARRLGIRQLYFGTDAPGFYTRLGAVLQEQPRPGFWFMRFDLA